VDFRDLIQEVVNSETGILITTYEHLRRQHADLLDVRYNHRQLHKCCFYADVHMLRAMLSRSCRQA
jgi:hypothetical protein